MVDGILHSLANVVGHVTLSTVQIQHNVVWYCAILNTLQIQMHQTLVCNWRQSGCRDEREEERRRKGGASRATVHRDAQERTVSERGRGWERKKEEMQLHHKQLREVQGG